MLNQPVRILVVQRKSHVSQVPFSRSVCARITEALDYLVNQHKVIWHDITEEGCQAVHLQDIDVVFFSKHVSDASVQIAKLAKEKGIPIIYDVDDWMLSFPSYSGAKIDEHRQKNFLEHMNLATCVTVANQRLAQLLSKYRDDLFFVPNGFWVEKYISHEPSYDFDTIRFVFTNADNLKVHHFKSDFLHVLDDILKRYPQVQFDFFGDTEKEMLSLKSRMNYLGSVAYDKHKQMLLSNRYSFAIVPLGGEEDPESFVFNSCKNPFKYLEYSGLGIPAIYSKCPIYEDVIQDNVNGLLVENTKKAWSDAIEKLITSPALCKELGQNGYHNVLTQHHIKYCANKFMEAIKKIS